jgi:hypothetical protein
MIPIRVKETPKDELFDNKINEQKNKEYLIY